jgi:hypothetical protein
MAPSYIRMFIDYEFSDLVDMHLIAIACVMQDGREYYAELDDDPKVSCNEFVQVRIPVFGGSVSDIVCSQSGAYHHRQLSAL